MESKSYALWTGVFTVGLVIVLVLIVGWMSRQGKQDTITYTFFARQSVTGLNKEAPVLLRGIPVGRVTDLSLDPADRLQVLVHAEIDSRVPLTTAMYGKLKPQGITGLMFVELFEEGRGKALLKPGQRIPMQPSDLQQFSEAITDIVGELKQVSSNLNGIMDRDNREHLKHMIGQLDSASTELPGLLQDTRAAVVDARQFMASVQQSASGVKDSFAGMRRDFHTTAARIDTVAQSFDATLAEVNGTLGSLNSTAAQLDRELVPGALDLIGQLDRSAYALNNLLRAQQRQPNRLIFGQPTEAPGPGEAGFTAQGAP